MSISLKFPINFASIDMGTNSFKLLIIQFEPLTAKFTTIHHHSSPVVLGRNLSSPSIISPESRSRAIQVLTEFKSILGFYDVTRTRVVGTSAIREASNQEEFINDVRNVTGFDYDVDLISGIEEGRLIYLGVVQFLPVYSKKVLIFDIGGGSTEFLIARNGTVLFVESLVLGHVTLSQKFGGGDSVALMRGYVYEEILASGLIGKVKELGFEVVIGSSGTVRAIEKAVWRERGCDEREMWWFSREELRGFVERLGCEGETERVGRSAVFGKRSEFIVAGAVILDVILEVFEVSEVKVSGFALGEGVVAKMVAECFPGCDLNVNVRWKSVIRLAMRFNGKDRMKKSVECATFAKEIFDGLKEYNNDTGVFLEEKDLEYLQAACMLHNIGLYYGKDGYHKRSCRIIMEHGQLEGYSTAEIELIAQLAKHHRKKFPTFEHASLLGFSGKANRKFGILCSILRISVIIQKNKKLKNKEVDFSHAREGFVLALVEKKDRELLPDDVQKSIIDDIERKISKETELLEAVYHKKITVMARKCYVEPFAKH